MLDILRDQIWQFIIGFIAILIAIVVPTIFYLIQRRKRELSYEIISNTSLVDVKSEFRSKIKILFEDNIVTDVRLLIIRIVNSGNVAIKPDDYVKPISFDLGKDARILEVGVVEENPKDLGMLPLQDEVTGKIVLNEVLLNKGDSVTFKVLVNRLGKIMTSGRIVDLKELKMRRDKPYTDRGFNIIWSIIFALITLVLTIIGVNQIAVLGGTLSYIEALTISSAVLVVILIGMVRLLQLWLL